MYRREALSALGYANEPQDVVEMMDRNSLGKVAEDEVLTEEVD